MAYVLIATPGKERVLVGWRGRCVVQGLQPARLREEAAERGEERQPWPASRAASRLLPTPAQGSGSSFSWAALWSRIHRSKGHSSHLQKSQAGGGTPLLAHPPPIHPGRAVWGGGLFPRRTHRKDRARPGFQGLQTSGSLPHWPCRAISVQHLGGPQDVLRWASTSGGRAGWTRGPALLQPFSSWGAWERAWAPGPIPAGLRAAWMGVRRGRPKPGPWCKGDKCGGEALCPSLGVTGRTVPWKDSAWEALPSESAAASTSAPGSPPSHWRGGGGSILRARASGTLARALQTQRGREEGEKETLLRWVWNIWSPEGEEKGSSSGQRTQ